MAPMSVWKLLGILFAILLGLGAILFVRQTYTYYQAIRSGEANPLLDRRLESTVSRLVANRNVSDEDLALLADPKAPSQGPADAPLTIVEFLDYGCPYCRAAFEPVRELALERPGQIRLIIRDFPLEDLHPGATKAAAGARCAQEQGKFWAYHDKLFLADQRSFEESDLFDIAREISLNVSKFTECVGSGRAAELVQADQVVGLRVGVQGTPTFFFNGVKVQGAPDAEALNYIVDEFLSRTANPATP
jgi:protein-disulfide isomerase